MDITSFILGTKVAGSGGAGVKYVVVEELPTTGEEGTIYLVPKSTSQTDNVYNEYMYINENWELIGDTQADLTDYVKNTDYATGSKGGVIKTGYSASIDNNGNIYAQNKSYVEYQSMSSNNFISKGTLENVIDGKGLITQYSTVPTASAETVGKIIQYTGTTDSTYTNGYFYIGKTDGQNPATYSWENIEVQGGGGIPTITQDTNIKDLEPGVYFVKKDIKFIIQQAGYSTYSFWNNNCDILVQVGPKNDWQIPFVLISWKDLSYSLPNGSGSWKNTSFVISGYGSTDTTGNISKRAKYLTGMIPNFGISKGTDFDASSNIDEYCAVINENFYAGDEAGKLACNSLTYSQYTSKNNHIFISKGTLNNVITGKELDLKQLSTYDATKTQVLKNINGTLTWVDEA